jgi:hypothetical protein
MPTKTDNKSLSLKVSIRRRIIDAAGLGDLRVLDLCSGTGAIWKAMRAFTKVIEYTPCDREPRMPGTIKGDLTPRFLQAFDLTRFNVVDVDAYGEPWEAWHHLAGRITTPTAVFLTHGMVGMGAGGSKTSTFIKQLMGIPKGWNVPDKKELGRFGADYCLSVTAQMVRFRHAVKCQMGKVAYYGILAEARA